MTSQYKMIIKLQKPPNTFFKNAVSTLDINENSYIVNNEFNHSHKKRKDNLETRAAFS